MTPYGVFIAAEVVVQLSVCRRAEKVSVARAFDTLAGNPFRSGDYVESDSLGRPVQIMLIGRHAVCYWADHAVKEVKILDLKLAGS
jgi:hypothetical protein